MNSSQKKAVRGHKTGLKKTLGVEIIPHEEEIKCWCAHIAFALSDCCGVALPLPSDERQEFPLATPEVRMLELAAALVILGLVEPVDVELSKQGQEEGFGRIHE